MNVKHNGKLLQLPLIIVNINQNISLLGRNWLHLVQLNWPALRKSYNVNFVNTTPYENLFDGSLGCYMGDPIKLTVDSDPTFHRARKVPYSIISKVEEALNNMESDGIIRKVKTASCAAPIVPIQNKSGDIRICGDFRVTYNKCYSPAVYPIPRIEDLHASLRGCTIFSTLDMSQAYFQIPIHHDSQQWLTINTHLGLYVFTRCPNGIYTAPALFQEIMDKTLSGVPHTIAYLDDILVAGVDQADHDANLHTVFDRISSSGFKLNKSTNGQCERVVQIVKSALRQARLTSEDPDTTLPRFLLRYRITPHTTTGESPSVLLYGRQLRTRLDLYRPSVSDNVSQKQQHLVNTSSDKYRFLQVGDRVRTRLYYVKGASWSEDSIVKVLGNRHYIVKIGENSIKRHIDQIIKCNSTSNVQCHLNDEIIMPKPIQIASSSATATDVPIPSDSASMIQPISTPKSPVASVQSPTATKSLSPPTVSDSVGLRRSSRITKPSTRYNDYVK